MHFTRFFLFLLWLLTSACSTRYAYLQKVKAPPRRGMVVLRMENYAPGMLSDDFKNNLEQFALKRLQKEGYRTSGKEPVYELVVQMRIDSSITRGTAFVGPGPGSYMYSRRSKGIRFDLQLLQRSNGMQLMEDQYEFYFFNDYRRDLGRARGVLRYMLSGLHESK